MTRRKKPLAAVFDRRDLLKAACLGVAAPTLAGRTGASSQDDAPEASVTFESQESDGETVVIANAQTDVGARLTIMDEDRREFVGRRSDPLEPGDSLDDITIALDEPIEETTQLSARLYHAEENHRIAISTATVFVGESLATPGYGPTLVDADPDAGFDYPYYLYAPAQTEGDEPAPILVEPTNSGQSTDEFEAHREAAERTVRSRPGRKIADGLTAPFVVPVFPRPRSDPVDGTHYVHALDNTTMEIDGGPLERVDLQLLAMVEDARDRLAERGVSAPDGIMLTGFSASGNFVERFTALHPDEVLSVTAGGLNGMPILPIEEAKGHTLDYHVGVANLEALTGEPFDLEAFRDVDQFLYMGELDTNDTIPYNDAWTGDFDQVALDVYGQDMQRDRFPYSKAVYESVSAEAVFRTYEGVGHGVPSVDDLVAFHERSLAGDDIETLRSKFGGNVPNLNAYIEYAPRSPQPGEQVAFDATRSAVADGEIVAYEWEFDGDTTRTGDLVTHTFETAGGHNVRLTVTDDAGETYQSVEQIVVGGATSSDTATDAGTETADDGQRSVAESLPGFGVATGLAGLGGAAYALKRQFAGERE